MFTKHHIHASLVVSNVMLPLVPRQLKNETGDRTHLGDKRLGNREGYILSSWKKTEKTTVSLAGTAVETRRKQ